MPTIGRPDYEPQPETDLTCRTSVTDLVARYQQAEKDMRDGFALVSRGLQAIEHDTNIYRRGNYIEFREPDDLATEMRRHTWWRLVERLQLRKIMSVKAWNELEHKLTKETPPPVTVELVEGYVRQMRADAPAMLEASVREVFEWLRPPSSRYKTNTEFEIGKRVVLSWIVSRAWGRQWHVEWEKEQYLTALENVFRLLDGKPVTSDGSYCSDLSNAIKGCATGGPCRGETEYFRFSGHKNRNLHIEFRRPDLVKRLNAIAGGARLKPVLP